MIEDNREPGQQEPEQTVEDQELVSKLADVCIDTRSDLKISRHLFQGTPSYVVHDPIRFQSHRFSQNDYEILSSIQEEFTLAEIFQRLVKSGTLDQSDEGGFYRFVLNLQMRGLLSLPITNSQHLYDSYVARTTASKKFSPLKLLFLKIPLVNPNQFLDRTAWIFKPMFSKPFFVLWLMMAMASLFVLVTRWDEFFLPFSSLLATRNLIIVGCVLTALKIWHEFGHAYACKIKGGDVPDMGAIFIVSLPCAYVDVSSSWCFTRKRDRIMVGLGGIYFESIAAMIALFIWAVTGPSVINSAAQFTVIMATLTTVLFNANPLMKFDGYYILSDVVGIPNLRDRSTAQIKALAKRFALGLKVDTESRSRREACWLTMYGIGAFFYQIWLMLSISIMVASQFFLLGIGMAATYVGSTIVGAIKVSTIYLWRSPECSHVRTRAICLSLFLLAGLPLLFSTLSVPGGTLVNGQLAHENEQVVRAPANVFVKSIEVAPGQSVADSQPIMSLDSFQLQEQFDLAVATETLAQKQYWAAQNSDVSVKKSGHIQLVNARKQLETVKNIHQQLDVTADHEGRVTRIIPPTEIGNFYPAGSELARIGNGGQVIRILMTEEQFNSANPRLEQVATCRFATRPGTSYRGTIILVEPAGSRTIDLPNLTHMAGGDIVVNPTNQQAFLPYFEVVLKLDQEVPETVVSGSLAKVRLGRKYESMTAFCLRQSRKFLTKLFTNK